MKITFKKQPKEKGLAAVCAPPRGVDIKCDKKIIGFMAPDKIDGNWLWSIRIAICDKTALGGWKWIALKEKGRSEEEAKEVAMITVPRLNCEFHEYKIEAS